LIEPRQFPDRPEGDEPENTRQVPQGQITVFYALLHEKVTFHRTFHKRKNSSFQAFSLIRNEIALCFCHLLPGSADLPPQESRDLQLVIFD
jgi:hypothetical protein